MEPYKRKRKKIDENAVTSAISEIVKGRLSLRKAAHKYKLNYGTLQYRIVRRRRSERDLQIKYEYSTKYSSQQVFTAEQEKRLDEYLAKCKKIHYGSTLFQLRQLAYEFAKKIGCQYPSSWDYTKCAGKRWAISFCKRNGHTSLKKPVVSVSDSMSYSSEVTEDSSTDYSEFSDDDNSINNMIMPVKLEPENPKGDFGLIKYEEDICDDEIEQETTMNNGILQENDKNGMESDMPSLPHDSINNMITPVKLEPENPKGEFGLIKYEEDTCDDEIEQETTMNNGILQENDKNGMELDMPSLPHDSQNDSSILNTSTNSISMRIHFSKSSGDKIKNINSTYLDPSLVTLNDTLQNCFANQLSYSTTQNALNLTTLTLEQSFGLFIATELKRIPEPERTKRKQAIIDILWKPI